MIEPNSINKFIKAIESTSKDQLSTTNDRESNKISPRNYLGKVISFVKAHLPRKNTTPLEKKFDSITRMLNQVSEKSSLGDKEISSLNRLKEALNGSSLPDKLRSQKKDLLNLIGRLQQTQDVYIPQEVMTNISSFLPQVPTGVHSTFRQARADLFTVTAEACQKSSFLQDYLPKEKNTDGTFFTKSITEGKEEGFVKDVYTNLMKEINQFPGYEDKKQELRDKYGSAMTVDRLEEMSKWLQPKLEEQLIKTVSKVAQDHQLTGLTDIISKKGTDQKEQANSIREWMKDNQASLKTISTINLQNQGIVALPKEIHLFSSVKNLNLSGNSLTSLPQELGQLNQLRQLELDENKFKSVPEAVTQLNQLSKLSLNHNQLTSLPKEIKQLKELRELNVGINQLTSIPPEIGALSELQGLNLGNNRLASIPPEFEQLTKLRKAYLNNNASLTISQELKTKFGNILET